MRARRRRGPFTRSVRCDGVDDGTDVGHRVGPVQDNVHGQTTEAMQDTLRRVLAEDVRSDEVDMRRTRVDRNVWDA
jgi:hypothetical protein